MRKCRDCSTKIANHLILCEKCKAIAEEKTKQKKREYKRVYKYKRKPKAPQEPHKCATSGCQAMVSARATFCRECRHERQLIQQREYCRRRKHIDDPLPDEPQTSLKFMSDISADVRNARAAGMSYGQWRSSLR